MNSPHRVNRGPAAAAENRAAILMAARRVFARCGAAAPMSAISTTAGVSPGVLYRHFPDREALIQAVFDEDIQVLERIAARPGCTLDDLLTAVIDQLVECTAFVATLRPDRVDPAHAAAESRVRALLAAASADGAHSFRPDATTHDLLLAIGLVAALLTKTPAPRRRVVADESWELIQRGLRSANC